MKYAAVRPMNSHASQYFTMRDLQTALRINPLLSAFGGHAVVPHGDLMLAADRLHFITQVRDPIERAVSQYNFWLNRMDLDRSWQAFLKHPTSQDFQVKKIAGRQDLAAAKNTIVKHFLLAGTVEQFDAFLVLLANKMRMPLTRFVYERKNVETSRKLVLPDSVADELKERNQLDQKLYDWVRTELFQEYIARYEGSFASDLAEFQRIQQQNRPPKGRVLIDAIYRNAYLKPVTGTLRVLHGLPFRGSYTTS